ncbi:MAG: hypothetical protein A2W93_13150 [Bacteroidetes bacterium GWF2_43_63]|nr:MAG: hypothetical protein A2W94_03455 [Bacteroidetes bacterium GWE2_42_42]OFY55130.1 MAG: hypothetical protein A2W93_13150 [Bacteroidetes bacterium GWF2_43_63]HBG70251.1 hypothetical protein [Bacteroidales bacterium]HCB63077.1 hypothetical protein [Bacteroidales bacterium]HCY22704.1 hypothetical protein [Bacteroidales bacterium]
MRFVRILNISVVVLFLALWIVLLIRKESYQGDGMLHPAGANTDATYFSDKLPYGINFQGDFMGFTSQTSDGKTQATGLWKLNLKTQSISHFPFPASHHFDSLVSVLPAADSTLTIVGLSSDSIVKLVHFDTLVTPGQIFSTPSDIKAVHYINGHPEIVFGRQKKLVGSIASVGDSSVAFRKYELPGFFDRICEIVGAWPEKNKWRFLLSSDFHHKDEKWVLIGSKNKTNFLVFDERAVFPDFPGVLNKSHKKVLHQFDYSISGMVPHRPYSDTLLIFRNNRFSEKILSKPKHNYSTWFSIVGLQTKIALVEWDDPNNESGVLVRHFFDSDARDSLPFVSESGKFVFHQREKSEREQIFMSDKEFPIAYFRLTTDSNVLITNKLNFSFLNDNGRLLDRKNFFKLVNTTILRKEPGTITFLDGEFPTLRALTWFVILYGLVPIWLLSLVVIWLVEAIRPKSKFAVRESKWPLLMRLMPGSALYLILYAINIYPFLQTFSIFIF